MNQNQGVQDLLKTLRDKSSDLSDRDDAAIALGEYDADEVLACLIEVASDTAERSFIVSSAVESISEILIRKNVSDPDFLSSLRRDAAKELREMLDIHFKPIEDGDRR